MFLVTCPFSYGLQTASYVHHYCIQLPARQHPVHHPLPLHNDSAEESRDGRVGGANARTKVGRCQRRGRVADEVAERGGAATQRQHERLGHGVGDERSGVEVVNGVAGVDGRGAEVSLRLRAVLAVGQEVDAIGGAAELLGGEPGVSVSRRSF